MIKRAQGFECANIHFKDYNAFTTSTIVSTLRQIVSRLPGAPQKWNVVIDHGCGDGDKVQSLRNFANSVWGIAILPQAPRLVDRYFCVDPNDIACTEQINDAEVDVTFVINYIGFAPHSTWRVYFSEHNERLAHYLLPQNFPRIIKKGGYLILSEWEA